MRELDDPGEDCPQLPGCGLAGRRPSPQLAEQPGSQADGSSASESGQYGVGLVRSWTARTPSTGRQPSTSGTPARASARPSTSSVESSLGSACLDHRLKVVDGPGEHDLRAGRDPGRQLVGPARQPATWSRLAHFGADIRAPAAGRRAAMRSASHPAAHDALGHA